MMAKGIDVDKLFEYINLSNKVDLTHVLEEGIPVYPTHPQYFHMEWNTGDPANLYQFLISEHAGTHMDSPAHFYGVKSEHHVSIEKLPIDRFFTKAIKLDFRSLDEDEELGKDDLLAWEDEHGILSAQAVIFNFGWDKKWKLLPAGKEFTNSWPGINASAAKYLVEKDINVVGTDCLGIDGSATTDLGSHYELLKNGTIILENLKNIDQLPNEFVLITLPLKIKDGTGSPTRAIALY